MHTETHTYILTLVVLDDMVSSGFLDKNSPRNGGDGELGVGGMLC